MKIALLSHLGGNIGHDFMATGMAEAVAGALPDAEQTHFEQHRHFSVYSRLHPLRLLDLVPHGRLSVLRRLIARPAIGSVFWRHAKGLRTYQLAIACGGPNIVRNVSRSAEMGLMFAHMYGAFRANGVPVYDLAVGACFPLERIPKNASDAFTSTDIELYRTLFQNTVRSSVRDSLARKLWAELGRDAALIPCVAFCSGVYAERRHLVGRAEPPFVAINFQAKGANDDWGQRVDSERWLACLTEVVRQISQCHRIKFICHSPWEERLAKQYFGGFTIVRPTTVDGYFREAGDAIAALTSRVHCAIPLASIGIPSILVGTDSRTGAVAELGLPTVYVKDAAPAEILHGLNGLIDAREQERVRLRKLRDATLAAYKKLIVESL